MSEPVEKVEKMQKQYDPSQIEKKWYGFWESKGLFRADTASGKEPFTIVIPPPNVTGVLHMGHALNDTIQDILIRSKRMQGFESLWVPGVDHAGIATQNVVEKKLARQGLDRHQLGREALIEEVWAWKNDREATIINQIKGIGCACDWSRYRFTMDERLSKAVRRVFVSLYRKGLVYRGNYIINWCPRCRTALSDEEAEHKPTAGKLYYIHYPIADDPDGAFITVATTRPETMLGDTGVAVNPEDERFSHLVGKKLKLPLVDRLIPIVADSHVDPKFGTGLVKVTPAHDPNDFEIGERHGLPRVNVMRDDGMMNEMAGKYEGLDRFECRRAVVADLKAQSLLEKVEDHDHQVGHCYRCDTMLEPYLSTQWFVAMKDLAAPAIEAVRQGRVKFHPERWTAIYFNWLENIRDWCISRQIWWGHQIPVWYCEDCGEVIVAETAPERCDKCGSTRLRQDQDVLDTWFSSQLWPFSTLGWPDETSRDLQHFYPTSVLSTAPDIIFFWVARMIMAGLEFMGEVPFRHVYLHGVVRDETGRAMSKSRGNTIDPLDVIGEFGADAMRFTLVSIAATGTDLYLSREKFNLGRNFANKLWNASRFVLMNFPEGYQPPEKTPQFGPEELAERWILSRLQSCATQVTTALDSFRLNDAAGVIYDFIWHDYCDWYIELSKERTAASESPEAERTRWVLLHVLESALRLLHPFMPFITEEIWQRLPSAQERENSSIYDRPWVEPQEAMVDREAETRMSLVQDIIVAVRTIRSEMNVPPGKQAELALIPADSGVREVVESHSRMIKSLARLEKIAFIGEQKKPPASGVAIVGATELFVPLKGLIDVDRERARLEKEAARLRGVLQGLGKKLSNENFLQRAPAEVIEKDRRKEQSYSETLERLENNMAQLEN
ncbi:MAG: valine--tRNA ligase [Gemmatimonadota bacterium]|nr:valine--tRNA ligase [Gemmatimonadota bacterium]